jgi:hypothetical protein
LDVDGVFVNLVESVDSLDSMIFELRSGEARMTRDVWNFIPSKDSIKSTLTTVYSSVARRLAVSK